MIFPGMDPYLEEPQIWTGVHATLVVYIRDVLQPALRPRYIAAVEERVYVEGPDREIIPDVWVRPLDVFRNTGTSVVTEEDSPVRVQIPELEVHEPYLTILDRQSGRRVVTVIEVVSPANKYAGPGRTLYLAKQKEVIKSSAHLVEIDLLRTGPHVLAVPERIARGREYDYLISVNRAEGLRDWFELYQQKLQHRLPRIGIPLAQGDPDVRLDLQAAVERVYEAGSYLDRLNYDVPCQPPLAPEDQEWASARVLEARKRAG